MVQTTNVVVSHASTAHLVEGVPITSSLSDVANKCTSVLPKPHKIAQDGFFYFSKHPSIKFEDKLIPGFKKITVTADKAEEDEHRIHTDSTFSYFLNNILRKKQRANMKIKIENNKFVPGDCYVSFGDNLALCFKRTLRVPDNGQEHPLPPDLGNFTVKNIDDYREKVPKSWLAHGGVFLPMYQAEACWIQFMAKQPHAIKLAVGKVNAITGEVWRENIEPGIQQDYYVAPLQQWIDGVNTGGIEEEAGVRQFVAMPLGGEYTVEAQVTGAEKFGGMQLKVFPMLKRDAIFTSKPSVLMKLKNTVTSLPNEDLEVYSLDATPNNYSLKHGDMIYVISENLFGTNVPSLADYIFCHQMDSNQIELNYTLEKWYLFVEERNKSDIVYAIRCSPTESIGSVHEKISAALNSFSDCKLTTTTNDVLYDSTNPSNAAKTLQELGLLDMDTVYFVECEKVELEQDDYVSEASFSAPSFFQSAQMERSHRRSEAQLERSIAEPRSDVRRQIAGSASGIRRPTMLSRIGNSSVSNVMPNAEHAIMTSSFNLTDVIMPALQPPLASSRPGSTIAPPPASNTLPEPVKSKPTRVFTGLEMGIACGGRMKQKVYTDPYGQWVWDNDLCGRLYVHIVNSTMWKEITGEPLPPSPINIAVYNKFGYPWYEAYDEGISYQTGSSVLASVKSVAELDKLKNSEKPNEETINPTVIRVGSGEVQDRNWDYTDSSDNDEDKLLLANEEIIQDGDLTISMTSQEKEAFMSIVGMGFSKRSVIEAYLLCDNNESLALNYLLSYSFPEET